MLEEVLKFILYGMPGWFTMTLAAISCLEDDDRENELLDGAGDE